jgi:hypothetical protein
MNKFIITSAQYLGLTTVKPLPLEKSMPKTPKPDEQALIEKTQPKPGTAVVDWKERLSAIVAKTKKAETPVGGFISLEGGRMHVGANRFPNDMIRAIVIDYRKEHQFYESAFVKGKAAAPVCFFTGQPEEVASPWRKPRQDDDPTRILIDEKTGLVSDSPKPQVEANKGCDNCKMGEWGSARLIQGKPSDSRGIACRWSRRLHIFPADQCTNPEDVAKAGFMTMIPPPTSLENFQIFANECVILKIPTFGVVVDISVKGDDRFQFKVYYDIVEKIADPGIIQALLARHEQISLKPIQMPRPSDDDATKNARGSKF